MAAEPDDELSPLDQDVAQELGPVLFRCRRRSQKEIDAGLSGDPAISYVSPFFGGLIGMIAVCGPILAFKADPEPLKPPLSYLFQGFCVAVFSFCTGASFWWTFRRPRTAALVMHRDGFRERRLRVRFSDLAGLWIGREPNAGRWRWPGSRNPHWVAWSCAMPGIRRRRTPGVPRPPGRLR